MHLSRLASHKANVLKRCAIYLAWKHSFTKRIATGTSLLWRDFLTAEDEDMLVCRVTGLPSLYGWQFSLFLVDSFSRRFCTLRLVQWLERGTSYLFFFLAFMFSAPASVAFAWTRLQKQKYPPRITLQKRIRNIRIFLAVQRNITSIDSPFIAASGCVEIRGRKAGHPKLCELWTFVQMLLESIHSSIPLYPSPAALLVVCRFPSGTLPCLQSTSFRKLCILR